MLDGQAITLTRIAAPTVGAIGPACREVLTRTILLMQIRGYGPEMRPRRVAAYIHGLRRELGVYAKYIETVPGVGCRFRPSPGP